ncbi:hypothetical protein [Halarchaeum nitratireducens]|nr:MULTISPECIES: hypothetical protein [Halarchaeum]MBP2251081.1 hypothetical protein [Halarchaeum solikamskense]
MSESGGSERTVSGKRASIPTRTCRELDIDAAADVYRPDAASDPSRPE